MLIILRTAAPERWLEQVWQIVSNSNFMQNYLNIFKLYNDFDFLMVSCRRLPSAFLRLPRRMTAFPGLQHFAAFQQVQIEYCCYFDRHVLSKTHLCMCQKKSCQHLWPLYGGAKHTGWLDLSFLCFLKCKHQIKHSWFGGGRAGNKFHHQTMRHGGWWRSGFSLTQNWWNFHTVFAKFRELNKTWIPWLPGASGFSCP